MNIKCNRHFSEDNISSSHPFRRYIFFLFLVSLSSIPSALSAGPVQNFIHKNNPSYTNKSVIQDHDWNGHEATCSSHTNCSECTSSEMYCHWCSSDQSCHSTKHWTEYSCVIGITDCSAVENNVTFDSNMEQTVATLTSSSLSSSSSSNSQCQRVEPEKITNLSDDSNRVSWITFLFILTFFGVSMVFLKFKSFPYLKNASKIKRFTKIQIEDVDDLTLQVENDLDEENDVIELTNINNFSIDDNDDEDEDINTKDTNRQNEIIEQPQEQELSWLQSIWTIIMDNIVACFCTHKATPKNFFWLRMLLIAISFIICSIGIVALYFNPKIPKVNIW